MSAIFQSYCLIYIYLITEKYPPGKITDLDWRDSNFESQSIVLTFTATADEADQRKGKHCDKSLYHTPIIVYHCSSP